MCTGARSGIGDASTRMSMPMHGHTRFANSPLSSQTYRQGRETSLHANCNSITTTASRAAHGVSEESRPASRGPRCAHPHQRHCSGLALLAALDSSQNRRTTDLISLRRDALAQLGPSFFGSCAARTSSSLCIPHDDPVRPGARIHGVQCP